MKTRFNSASCALNRPVFFLTPQDSKFIFLNAVDALNFSKEYFFLILQDPQALLPPGGSVRVEVSFASLSMVSFFGFAFGVTAVHSAPEGRSVPMRFEESDP